MYFICKNDRGQALEIFAQKEALIAQRRGIRATDPQTKRWADPTDRVNFAGDIALYVENAFDLALFTREEIDSMIPDDKLKDFDFIKLPHENKLGDDRRALQPTLWTTSRITKITAMAAGAAAAAYFAYQFATS